MAKLTSKERETILEALRRMEDIIKEDSLVEEGDFTASEFKALQTGSVKLEELFEAIYG